ncbi:MAG: C40 family peptidase [Bacteroides sp.]|nr:C40 family peptidase [Bacteroides sp.]MCM1412926.1 C40 family peptidase [Bacteroides sp.]MCM1471595.1 C40 family peptidase [Bacteroides sp.]
MDLKKIIISAAAICFIMVSAYAQKIYRLPQQHQAIAEKEVEANLGIHNPFATVSMNDVCRRSPFADMYEAAKSVKRSNSIINPKASRMVDYAARFLGTRYVLGATGPKAFDCSGFTSYVYKNFGITLNRTSRDQYRQGEKVSVNNLRPGDLLFFSSRTAGRGNVGHVAMVVSVNKEDGSCTFIHASVKKGVTYQKFPDNGYFSRTFIGARRILGTSLDKGAGNLADNN